MESPEKNTKVPFFGRYDVISLIGEFPKIDIFWQGFSCRMDTTK